MIELYREDIARIPALLATTVDEDPMASLDAGTAPALRALQIYNSTVYRWNRPCYGLLDGTPHLRIECRVLPSGPSMIDEVANAAFWIGLMLGGADAWPDIHRQLEFEDVRANFLAAARRGLRIGINWIRGEAVAASDLILNELLPLAHAGLEGAGIREDDRRRYLGVVEARVRSAATGAHWLERSLAHLGASGSRAERMAALTAAMVRRQRANRPIHEWSLAEIAESGGWRYHYLRVDQFMTTDLFTVREDELVDLAALLMDWRHVRQVPVEDDQRRLVGMVDYGSVLRLLATRSGKDDGMVSVKDIMLRDPPTVRPDTSTLAAIRLMRELKVTSLPVVEQGKLVGIVSVGDFMPIAERLLEERLDHA